MNLTFPDYPREALAPDFNPYALTMGGDLYPVRITTARVLGHFLWVRTHAGLVVPVRWAWCSLLDCFVPYGWRVPLPDPFLFLVGVPGD